MFCITNSTLKKTTYLLHISYALLSTQATLVPTSETTRVRFFADMLLEKKRPIMLVGTAGTGKTVLMGDKLNSLPEDDYLISNVPFNFYTTSQMLQGMSFIIISLIGLWKVVLIN